MLLNCHVGRERRIKEDDHKPHFHRSHPHFHKPQTISICSYQNLQNVDIPRLSKWNRIHYYDFDLFDTLNATSRW